MNNGNIDTTVASALVLILGYSLSASDGSFALSLSRFDELRVFPGVWGGDSFFLGSPFLSSDVDLTVEGFFAFSSGCIDCSGFAARSFNGVSFLFSHWLIGLLWYSFLRRWLVEFSNCFHDAIWFGKVIYLLLESKIFLLDGWFGVSRKPRLFI